MEPGVTQILAERHGLSARPGAKVTCPFCGKKTFSIKRDDSIGKCFHPHCGRYVTPFQARSPLPHTLMEQVYHDFHQELVGLCGQTHRNAYSYLVDERKVHPQVVADAMLGAVPSGYNVAAVFRPSVQELEKRIEAEAKRKKGQGRPKERKGPTAAETLDALKGFRDSLARCVSGRAGWLAFFYTDERHRIVAVRFREPFSKRMAYFKPFEAAGLFGHGMFSPYRSEHLRALNDLLIVVEGEVNALQIQSLSLRYGEATGTESGYVYAAAVGGVTNADYATIRKLVRSPIICYDNDASDAGKALLMRACGFMSVTAFTTPGTDSDLDSFIRSFGDDHTAAWEAVRELVKGRAAHPRFYEGVARQIHSARQKHGKLDVRREFEIYGEVADIIRGDLADRGRFHNDGRSGYFFFEAEKRLVPIDPENQAFGLALARYGINRSERVFTYLVEDLHAHALEKGGRTEVHRLTHFDRARFTLYLFNHGAQIYRIGPEAIELVDNGTDGILFLEDPKHEPFEADGPNPPHSPLDEVLFSQVNVVSDVLTPDERRLVFMLWFYSLFFEELMPTKPIMALIGPKGSTKTSTIRKVGMLLFGSRFDAMPLTKDVRDFDAAVTASPYVAIDNADSKVSWLNDRLATVATGGSIKRRAYYTTNDLVEYPVRCFLAITSRTPYYRRDDVADRLLIMKVERLAAYRSEKALRREVLGNRDLVMSEIVHHLQEIVRALKASAGRDESEAFRMADFADFAVKVARHAGIEGKVRDIFGKLTREQSSFTLESDTIFELLNEWVESNPGREVTNAELCAELRNLAEKKSMDFEYEGKTRAFAQRMNALRSNLEELFEITKREAKGRRRLYCFTPKRKDD